MKLWCLFLHLCIGVRMCVGITLVLISSSVAPSPFPDK